MRGLERGNEPGGHGNGLSGTTGLSFLSISRLGEWQYAVVDKNRGVFLDEPGGHSRASTGLRRSGAFAAAVKLQNEEGLTSTICGLRCACLLVLRGLSARGAEVCKFSWGNWSNIKNRIGRKYVIGEK